MPVWETLLLDAGGTLVTLATTALAAWLLHRAGKLAPVTGALGRWLQANTGAISAEVERAIEELLAHRHLPNAAPAAGPVNPTGPPIPPPAVLQGDAGFHDVPGAGVDPLAGAGGGGGGQPGGVPTDGHPGGTATAWDPRG